MLSFLVDIWQSMNDFDFFYYVPAALLLFGFICLFKSFFSKGVQL